MTEPRAPDDFIGIKRDRYSRDNTKNRPSSIRAKQYKTNFEEEKIAQKSGQCHQQG
ncbi:hypothetical protein [Methylomonas methanica]|uniref:hypothetical protein n=1 Tax=Methylomonas methanica TaxID=421 RepID=UPI0012F67FE8|nr:hypothetical protein [Methylomonas methanica]